MKISVTFKNTDAVRKEKCEEVRVRRMLML
jgi:hypothetical protein